MTVNQETNQAQNATKIPTGIDFLDRFLQGGQTPGHVYGLLEPMYAGKTTLGLQIAVEGALALGRSGGQGEWAYVTIDRTETELNGMILSHAAKILREKAEALPRISMLNPPGVFWEYERRRADDLPRDPDSGILSESERLEAVAGALRKHLNLIDFPSFVPPNDCDSYVRCMKDEIARLSHPGAPLAGVVIHYASCAVNEHLGDLAESPAVAAALVQFVVECKTMLAQPHSCPVWVIQQLSAKASGRAPGDLQHHKDAFECRKFGDSCDACIVLGVPDWRTDVRLVHCTKYPGRSTAPVPVTVEVDSDFATMRETSDYDLDPTTRKIRRIDEPNVQIDEEAQQLLQAKRSGSSR